MDTNAIQNFSVSTVILLFIASGSFSVIITLAVNWIKDIWEERKREKKRLFAIKENAYREVMKNIDFVYRKTNLTPEEILKKKNNFLENYRLMFLYSEDEVIKEINNVLDTLVSSWPKDIGEMKEKKDKIARSMIILRKQIITNTGLTEKDFKHVT